MREGVAVGCGIEPTGISRGSEDSTQAVTANSEATANIKRRYWHLIDTFHLRQYPVEPTWKPPIPWTGDSHNSGSN